MALEIATIAVIGGGTMGSGIAALAAAAGRKVLILEIDKVNAEKARQRALATAATPEERARLESLITIGTSADDLPLIAEADWICEAITEDLAAKRQLFARIEPLRREGSVASTNTSGIPLRDITAGLPERLRQDIVVTHFFNPVRMMRLLELIPGSETRPAVLDSFVRFGREVLGKGIVHAKDTVNFIGNRIGCFWMLSGLHKAKPYLTEGLSQERIDALMGTPVGLPSTGLYGLIDLIGLDVMDHVGRNLALNLPDDDPGRSFARFPETEQALLERGQLGRKSGGGFYRILKQEDGSKSKEVFDLFNQAWRPATSVSLAAHHAEAPSLVFGDDIEGRFTWDLLVGTLLYAADLIPEIADDLVNVDRAMRWGFAWQRGPFELLDHLGPSRIIARLEAVGQPLPRMLATLKATGAESFYQAGTYLGTDGEYHPVPAE